MKFLAIIITFFIGIIIFMPKENLFFTLQKELKKDNIYINTNVSSNIQHLNLKNSTIFINNIDIATIKQTNILPFIIYNKIDIDNLKINFNNLNISKLHLTYSIINPLHISINGISDFANIQGDIDLTTRKIKIYFLNLTNNSIKDFLRKDQKGYYYAETF